MNWDSEENVVIESGELSLIDLHPPADAFLEDALSGLALPQKAIPCKYFYDKRGSELFEQITEQPEYYVTRTEMAIMKRYIPEILEFCEEEVNVIELGSGSSAKTRTLLAELKRQSVHTIYTPIDISRDFLFEAARSIAGAFSDFSVQAICADFMQGMQWINEHGKDVQRLVYFPGSTIGNFTPAEALALVADIGKHLQSGDGFILGTDLIKNKETLHAAYNDAKGITAQFNLNVLERMNAELGADFPIDKYKHVAFFNDDRARIEIYVESGVAHTLTIAGHTFEIGVGERIQTEYSHKYTPERIYELAEEAGFNLVRSWMDDNRYFAVHFLQKC